MRKVIIGVLFGCLLTTACHAALTAGQKSKMRRYFRYWVTAADVQDVLDTRLTSIFNMLSEAQQEAVFTQMKADIVDYHNLMETTRQGQINELNAGITTLESDIGI